MILREYPTKMNVTVQRKLFSNISTIGELCIDGVFQCHTLEDTVRKNQPKIPGATAIPAGTYQVIIDDSVRFNRPMPHILDVPGFEGVRIHSGNTDKDTEGCLLLGTYDAQTPDWISNSQISFTSFFVKLSKALTVEEVFISIG